MNKKKQTDRIIRNKLKYHASPSPDHLWDAIDAQLPLNKKRRGGFWWKTSGLWGSLFIVAIFAFVLLNSEGQVYSLNESLGLAPSLDVVIQNNETNSVMPSVQNEKTTSILFSEKVKKKITKKINEPLAEKKWITKRFVKKENPKRSITSSSNLSTKAVEFESLSKPLNAVVSAINKETDVVVPQNLQVGLTTDFHTDIALELPTESIIVDHTEKEMAWPSLMVDTQVCYFWQVVEVVFLWRFVFFA